MAWIMTAGGPRGARGRGIAAILLAVLLLSVSDALVKSAGDRFGLAQIVLLRSAVAAGLLAGWLGLARGRDGLRLARPGWARARSLCLAAMWLSYYAALPSMSFALAAACYYTAPAWMALMTRGLLGAPMGGRGWAAVGLALAGALLAIGPAEETLSPALAAPLAAAVFYALAGIITWRRCGQETAGALALNLNLWLVALAGVGLGVLAILPPGEGFARAVWPALGAADWGLALLLGGLMAVIATAVAQAYRLAPTPVVGVFDTAYLGFAALWGALLFAEVPTMREALGLALIALGAALMSLRGRRAGGCA